PESPEVEGVGREVGPEEPPVRVGDVGRERHRRLRELDGAAPVLAGGADAGASEQGQAHRLEVSDGQRVPELREPVTGGAGGLRVPRALRVLPGAEGLEERIVTLGRDEERRRRGAVTPRRRGGYGGRLRSRRRGAALRRAAGRRWGRADRFLCLPG